ncbi:MAG: 30S ribosomal protein S13 [Candidatus Moranbacteria bacterium]|jgi:small subunit ribosomal protein S13|nr:30S ribosomal protein S13 [Candidatus Moranbacteria bacterium]
MVRIAGVNIPDNKRVEIALTYIYGIGLTTSQKILKDLSISPDTRTKDLTSEEANNLREVIEKKHRVEGELRHLIKQNIKRLKEIGSFRGSRHQKGLPSRGQRTKTNTRTVRGNTRKTMGSGRKKADSKT